MSDDKQSLFEEAVKKYGTPFICPICLKPYTENDRLAALGECTCSGWDADLGYIDEVEPVNAGWDVVHYNCLYKEKKKDE